MSFPTKLLVAIGVIAVLASLAWLHFIPSGSNHSISPPQIQGVSEVIPSVATLMDDPVALRNAAKACDDGTGSDVVVICQRVHSAEAQLLAEKYREGPKP